MPKTGRGATIYDNRQPKRKKIEINFDDIIKQNVNPKGRTRSIEENKLLIQSMAYFQKNGMTLDQSLKQCIEMFGGCYYTYKTLWEYFMKTGNLDVSETHLQRGVEMHKYYEISDLDSDCVNGLIEFAFHYTILNKTGFSIPDVLSYFENEHNIIMNTSAVQYLLHMYNFCWSQQPVYYGNEYQDNRLQEMQRFLFQYSHALTLENIGTHVIVAIDESWANTGTSSDHSWLHMCGNEEDCIVCNEFRQLANGDAKASIKKANVGKRNVFAHAITREGLLAEEIKCEEIDRKAYITPTFEDIENLDLKLNTCEFIIECGNDNSIDFHQQMDFQKFIKYFENRVIHSCNNLIGGKKAIIFMDQCPFHMVCEGFPSTSDNKKTIINYYKKHNITSISLRRYNEENILSDILTFKLKNFDKHPRVNKPENGGPSKNELFMYLFVYLKLKNPSELEPIVCKIAKKYNHLVLYSCPYNPNDMPIEYLNSYVKCNVKQCCLKNRTINQLKLDIRNGFYGGELKNGLRQHKCVSNKMTNGWFKKCEENMNKEINNILNINNKNIHGLWNVDSEISLTNTWVKLPKTLKTLKKLSEKFVIVIDNVNQSFI
jgi:hypothetical protein